MIQVDRSFAQAICDWLRFGLGMVLAFAAGSASAQLEALPDKEPHLVFAGGSRTILVQFHNPGAVTAEADIRIQTYQTAAGTTAPLGETRWKHLQVLPGQTVLESAQVNFPAVRAETKFLLRWVTGDGGTGFQPVPANRADAAGRGRAGRMPVPLLGTTEVLAYPTNLLVEIKSLAEGEALGVFDPRDLLKPLLRRSGVAFTDLEDAGVAGFRGKLAILGPFPAAADAPADLGQRVGAMAGKGVAAVWFQPPPGPREKLQPSFRPVPFGTNAVVIAQAGLVANLAASPRAQLNLLELCRVALRPEPPKLPLPDAQP